MTSNSAGIPNNRLYIRFDHKRDENKGVILTNGEVTYKETAFVNADPFGIGGKVDVGNVIDAGTVEIRPIFSKVDQNNSAKHSATEDRQGGENGKELDNMET